MVGAWYGALWRPAQKHLATLRAEQVVAADNVLSFETQVDALRADQKQVPKERVALCHLDDRTGRSGPGPADQGNRQRGQEAGMSLTSWVRPRRPAGDSSVGDGRGRAGPQSIAVSLQGSDRSVLRFVTDLDSEPRLFVVNSFDLDSAPGASQRPGPARLAGGAGTAPVGTYRPGSARGRRGRPANTYSVSITAFFVSEASNNPVFPGNA